MDQDIVREQNHLQAISTTYSRQVAGESNLPLPLRNSEGPEGQKLINLSF